MKIALTGATGFLGRYIANRLAAGGHSLRAWHRATNSREGLDGGARQIEWVAGSLGDEASARDLLRGCDAVVHSALYRPGPGFREIEGELGAYLETNFMGTIQLIESACALDVPRFILISTCAVHDVVLDDRPLDERHPAWPKSHYGALKAALEAFVHSYGFGRGYQICALRPTGIYGAAVPVEQSKWYDLVKAVVRNEPVECARGGKEVHAADVAKAAELLLGADNIAGEVYNCYDMYIAERDVAEIVKELSGSQGSISGARPQPKHQIETGKLRSLGMTFGGAEQLRNTLKELVEAAVR